MIFQDLEDFEALVCLSFLDLLDIISPECRPSCALALTFLWAQYCVEGIYPVNGTLTCHGHLRNPQMKYRDLRCLFALAFPAFCLRFVCGVCARC